MKALGTRHVISSLPPEIRAEFTAKVWNYFQTYGSVSCGSIHRAAKEIYTNSRRAFDELLAGHRLSRRQKVAMIEAEMHKLIGMGRLECNGMYVALLSIHRSQLAPVTS